MQISTIINSVIQLSRIHFTESIFTLQAVDFNRFVISGNNLSKAVNHGNDVTQVNVLHWFEKFWLYLEISFVLNKKKFPPTFISISVFQGEAVDETKNQLFRAEWDSYEMNDYHPQPHWHIYPFKYEHGVYEDFETFNEMKVEEEGFTSFIKPEFQKIIDVRKMHFAMNAEWPKGLGIIHQISDVEVITKWIQGVLGHAKYQINYAKGE